MPLLDHFHAPISQRRTWEGFHSLWAAAIVEYLNRDVLSSEYFADMQVHIGGALEVDVATLREPTVINTPSVPATWQPSPPTLVIPTVFPDEIEIQVFSTSAGASLVAAIEMVSPANKDREETRKAFASKCISYLTRGIGLVVIDVVTNRLTNLHNELMADLELDESFAMPTKTSTYCVAYHPVRTETRDRIDAWLVPLEIGDELPTLPLALLNAGMVPLDLEGTYATACERSRLQIAA